MPKTVMEMADDILANMGVSDAVPLSEAKQEPVHAVGKTYQEDLPEVNDEQRMQFIQESMTVGKKIKKLKKEGKPQDQAVAIALDMKDDGKLKEMYAVQGNPTGPDGRNFDNAWKLSKKDRAKLSGEKCNEDLRKWVAEKWVDIGAPKKGGGFKPCGRSKGEKRKGYPKCVPSSKAASMSKSERTSAVRRKRAAGNAGPKPTNVKTMKESYVIEAKLCARGKAAAKRKFKVYPSAYANMYASAVCSGKVTPGGKKGKKKSVKESDNHFPDENKATNTADEIKKMRKVNLKEKMEKSDKGTEAQQARRAASKAISSAPPTAPTTIGDNVEHEASKGTSSNSFFMLLKCVSVYVKENCRVGVCFSFQNVMAEGNHELGAVRVLSENFTGFSVMVLTCITPSLTPHMFKHDRRYSPICA